MSKKELTKKIENLLYSYNPKTLANIKLNKFRPSFTVNECVVETGTVKSGIVDVMRLDETIVNQEYIRICKGYLWYHSKNETQREIYKKKIMPCGHDKNTCPYYCKNTDCEFNSYTIGNEFDFLITCFEIKISKTDFYSKNGHNFVGNANYYVMPKDVYNEVKEEIPEEIGVILLVDTDKILGLRKVKECTYRELSDTNRMWLILNILKKYKKEAEAKIYG